MTENKLNLLKIYGMANTLTLRQEVKKYIDDADEHVVKMVYAMLKADSEADWWDELEEEEKASIERGLDDLKNGRVISHEEVMKQYPQWFSK